MRQPAASLLLFLTAGLLLTVVLAFAVPLVPGQFRKLLLFPAAVCAAAGWLLAVSAAQAGWQPVGESTGRLTALAALLIAGCLGGMQGRTYLEWRRSQPEAVAADRIGQIAADLQQSGAAPDAMKNEFHEAVEQGQARIAFPAWLRHRLSRLGDWSAAGAAAFFLVESGLAVACGVWIFRRTLPRRSTESPR